MNIPPPIPRSAAAFSVIELLTVACIITIMLSLTVPAVSHLQKANALNSAGNMLVDSVILARDTASSSNTFSCMVVTAPDKLPQKIAVLEYRPENSVWKQVAPWGVLPETMRIEDLTPSSVSSSVRASVNQLAPVDLKISGDLVDTNASMILFPPETGVASVGGHRLSARYLNEGTAGSPNNFYDVVINPESKAHRVLRP